MLSNACAHASASDIDIPADFDAGDGGTISVTAQKPQKGQPHSPQATAGLLSRHASHRSLGSKRHPVLTRQFQRLDTITTPPVSQAVPVISLNFDVQTMGYPTGGANAFILPTQHHTPDRLIRTCSARFAATGHAKRRRWRFTPSRTIRTMQGEDIQPFVYSDARCWRSSKQAGFATLTGCPRSITPL